MRGLDDYLMERDFKLISYEALRYQLRMAEKMDLLLIHMYDSRP